MYRIAKTGQEIVEEFCKTNGFFENWRLLASQFDAAINNEHFWRQFAEQALTKALTAVPNIQKLATIAGALPGDDILVCIVQAYKKLTDENLPNM